MWNWFFRSRREGDPSIFWALRSGRQLNATISSLDTSRDHTLQQLNDRLRLTFPGESTRIVVQQLYSGYRPDAEKFILLVEVESLEEGRLSVRPKVVKIFLGKQLPLLEKEWKAWDSCQLSNMENDKVLMMLKRGPDRNGQAISLIYSDAEEAIGIPNTVPLEEAVLDSVLYGNPTVASVRNVLVQLFVRLGLHLYGGSRPYPDKGAPATSLPATPPIDSYVAKWKSRKHDPEAHPNRGQVQKQCNHAGSPVPGWEFKDPVDYLVFLKKTFALGTFVTKRGRQLPLVPTYQMGRAHGDLHGRNCLVGITKDNTGDDKAIWLALFDYEKMGKSHPIALDFVKLETELKIRALPRVLRSTRMQSFIPQVQEFEHVLRRWTLFAKDGNRWPRGENGLPSYWPPDARAAGSGPAPEDRQEPDHADQLCRLLAILLEIRESAAHQLGSLAGQPDWFRQYQFWLLVYGVRVVSFTNLTELQLSAAYLSAGVAAVELSEGV